MRGGTKTRPEVSGFRCIESQKTTNVDGGERTFRFLQTSQALQTLARTTLAGLQRGQTVEPRSKRRSVFPYIVSRGEIRANLSSSFGRGTLPSWGIGGRESGMNRWANRGWRLSRRWQAG